MRDDEYFYILLAPVKMLNSVETGHSVLHVQFFTYEIRKICNHNEQT